MYDKDDVISEIYDGVSHHKGLGDSGSRIVLLEHECNTCGYDRVVCKEEVNPEEENHFAFFCLKPSCPEFVGDELSHYFNY